MSPKRYKVLTVTAIVLAIFLVVSGIVQLLTGFSTSTAVQTQEQAAARLDCARKINDERTALIDKRDAIEGQIFVFGIKQDATAVIQLGKDLDVVLQKIAVRPPSSVLVDRRCPSV